MHPLDTRWRQPTSHATGEIVAEGVPGKHNRVLFAVPKSTLPQLQVVAFPGDAVECIAWHALAGATGVHPHAGGMLATLFERLQLLGGAYASAAILVVEPARVARTHHAMFEHLLPPPLTASGEPAEGYSGAGSSAAHLDGLLTSVHAHLQAVGYPSAPAVPLLVFGFSKGATVCNQLLFELATLDATKDRAAPGSAPAAGAGVLERIAEVHFLDAGLPCRGAHLTDPNIANAVGRATRLLGSASTELRGNGAIRPLVARSREGPERGHTHRRRIPVAQRSTSPTSPSRSTRTLAASPPSTRACTASPLRMHAEHPYADRMRCWACRPHRARSSDRTLCLLLLQVLHVSYPLRFTFSIIARSLSLHSGRQRELCVSHARRQRQLQFLEPATRVHANAEDEFRMYKL